MQISKRALSVSCAALLGLALVVAACTERTDPLGPGGGGPVTPGGPLEGPTLQVMRCSAVPKALTVACAPQGTETGGGISTNTITVGGQRVYVELLSGAPSYDAGAGVFAFDVTVRNLIPQAMGTLDGTTLHPQGVRTVFSSIESFGTGTVEVGNEDGTMISTAADQPYFQYDELLQPQQLSAPKNWQLNVPAAVDSFRFTLLVSTQVQWRSLLQAPAVAPVDMGDSVDVTVETQRAVGLVIAPPRDTVLTFTSLDPGIATVEPTGPQTARIFGVAQGTARIVVDRPPFFRPDTMVVTVNDAPVATSDTVSVAGNVTGVVAFARRLLANDSDRNGDDLFIPAGARSRVTAAGASLELDSLGTLRYHPVGGFAGLDSVFYVVTDGVELDSARVFFSVSAPRYWFVDAEAAEAGDGSQRRPFRSPADVGTPSGQGDTILVRPRATETDGGLVLKDGQRVVGGAAGLTLTVTRNDTTVTVFVPGVEQSRLGRTSAGALVTLGQGNVIEGVRLGAGSGAAVQGSDFGSVRIANTTIVANGGAALDLTNGAADVTVDSLSSGGSAGAGLSLSNVTGTVSAQAGGIAGMQGAGIRLAGGSVDLTFHGSVTQAQNAALLSVTGGHAGTVALSTGALIASAGPGLALGDADGQYTLGGTTSLTGGARLVIGSASTGAFTFAAGTGITYAGADPAVDVAGTVSVTYAGSVTQSGAGAAVAIHDQGAGGDVRFQTGTISATGGTGIRLSNADGDVSFLGTVSLNGGDAGVDVVNGSDGSFDFGTGTSITNPSGTALDVNGGAPALLYRGTISTAAGRAVSVQGITGDSVVVSGSVSSGTQGTPTGLGILVQNNTGGRVAFTGTTKSLHTGANPAVTVSGNTGGAAVAFRNGGLVITTTTGAGFDVSNTAAVTVTGEGNTVASAGGIPLRIVNSGVSPEVVRFRSVSATGGANGIVLSAVTGDSVQVTGDGSSAGSGGTITGVTGAGVSLSNVGAVSLAYLSIGGVTGITGGTFSSLTSIGTTVAASGGPALSLSNGTVNGSFGSLSSSGSTGNGISLSNVNGSFTASGGTIGTAASTSVVVNGGGVGFTYAGSVTQTTAQPLLLVSGGHTGTLGFQTGTLQAGTGRGLQFDNADGSYTFSGPATLNGGGAGVDIGNGSGGSFTFGTGVSVSTSVANDTAFSVSGSAPTVTYNGSLSQTAAGTLVAVTDLTAAGSVTFQTGTVSATNGQGITLNNADGTVAFNGTTTLNGGNAGVDVVGGSGGTISFGAGATITNPDGEVIGIRNSAPTFTYAGSFTKNNNGNTGLVVQNNTGGTLTFSGSTKTLSTGAGTAVSLTSNAGATIAFAGGNLNLATTTGTAFNATGGGTVMVTGSNNQAASAGGTTVNIQNTTIGSNGVAFRSVAANGGANGIVLVNTGSTGGGFGVTGDGATAGSGGTIQNTTGADGATAGNGVYLDGARAVSLAYLALSNHPNHSIRGNNVTGFTMNRVRITGTSGTNSSIDEAAVSFTQLLGSAAITGSNISGSIEDNVRIVNSSGTLNRIVFDADTFGLNHVTTGNDGLFIQATGTATVNSTIQNSRFTAAGGDLLQVDVIQTGVSDLILSGNTFTNNHSNIASGGGGVTIAAGGGGSPTLTYQITNNSFRDALGTALVVNKTTGTGTATGTITGNTIGVAGSGNSGSAQGSGINLENVGGGTHTATISNNQIRQYTNYGIYLSTGNNAAGNGGQGRLRVTVQGNTIAESSPNSTTAAFPTNGIHLNGGTNSGDNGQMCLTIGGAGALANSIAGSGANGGTDFRLRQRFNSTVALPGYAGAANGNAAVVTFVQGNNGNPTGSAASSTAGGGGFTGSCPF